MTYTPVHGKAGQIFYDVYDVSQYFDKISAASTVDEVETTTFQATAKTWLVGFRDGKITASGFWDQTATVGSDPLFQGELGSATDNVLIYAPAGATSVANNSVKFCQTKETNFTIEQGVGDAIKIKAEWLADGGIQGGYNLRDYSTTVTGNVPSPTSVDYGAAFTLNKSAGAICVTDDTGGVSCNVKVQYSTNNSSWSDAFAFSSITTPTKEYKTATHAAIASVRYIRFIVLNWVGSGSMTMAIAGMLSS